MRIKVLFISFLLALKVLGLYAQDSTIGIGQVDSSVHKKTLIIPFEPDLYISDMDREIGLYNGMTQPQIVEKLRINFDRVLENTVQIKNETQSILHDETTANEGELVNIYSKISFVFTPVKRVKNKTEKIASAILPQKKVAQKEASIKNGEVYTVRDTLERYMKVILTDTTLLENLATESKAENFLFVTQFELKNSFDDVIQMQNDTYQRELRVHYSILNVKGEELLGGIAKSRISNKVIDINQIVSQSFPSAAKQIADALIAYEKTLIKIKSKN